MLAENKAPMMKKSERPHSTPALSSVEQDSEVAGRLLVEAVLDRIAGAEAAQTPIPMRLVVRESCGLR